MVYYLRCRTGRRPQEMRQRPGVRSEKVITIVGHLRIVCRRHGEKITGEVRLGIAIIFHISQKRAERRVTTLTIRRCERNNAMTSFCDVFLIKTRAKTVQKSGVENCWKNQYIKWLLRRCRWLPNFHLVCCNSLSLFVSNTSLQLDSPTSSPTWTTCFTPQISSSTSSFTVSFLGLLRLNTRLVINSVSPPFQNSHFSRDPKSISSFGSFSTHEFLNFFPLHFL